MSEYLLRLGDCQEVLKTIPDASVDACVTDPPYELGFMGKTWDASGIAYRVELWQEVLRTLKPGAHLLSFGGTRTYHRMTCAIEDAGFEIRDSIHWLYSSGFPKSYNISKGIDKAANAERTVTGKKSGAQSTSTGRYGAWGNDRGDGRSEYDVTIPATDDAVQWNGWGTTLKPAHEPIVLARKPFVGTVAANVVEHGTGGLNIDGCRIPSEPIPINKLETWSGFGQKERPKYTATTNTDGRWPANVVLDEGVGLSLDQQRFFYCAKASKRERNTGVEGNNHPTIKPVALMTWLVRLITPPDGVILDPFMGSGSTGIAALKEGFYFVGIEQDSHYYDIAESRVKNYE